MAAAVGGAGDAGEEGCADGEGSLVGVVGSGGGGGVGFYLAGVFFDVSTAGAAAGWELWEGGGWWWEGGPGEE